MNPLNAITYQYVAKVTKIRGKVTILSPGELKSRKLSIGDRVKEDTSIVTSAASFARLVFDDGSTLNIGPKSKAVVVRMDKKGNGIVSLLKGKMRSNIKKNAKGTKKFYIQTRTAAMAVRGTEFETIYNPENRVSSLLTYKGEVAVSKTDDLIIEKTPEVEKSKVVVRNGKRIRVVNRPIKKLSQIEKMAKVFEKKETVLVKGGQFSTTVKKLDIVSQPVKISPVQLNRLYKNPSYLQNKGGKTNKANLDLNQKGLAVITVEQEAPAEGFLDIKNKKFAAKAGGFLDLDTGLYVAPGADATFDAKKNIFQVKSGGSIDDTTGQYSPPKGLKLAPTQGFVIDKSNLVASTDTEKIKIQMADLNQSLGKDLVLTDKHVKTDLFTSLVNRELFSKNVATLSVKSYDLDYEQSKDTYLGNSQKYEGVSVRSFDLSLRFSSGKRLQPFTSLSLVKVDSESAKPTSIAQDGDELWNLEAGFYYSLKPRINLLLSLALNQQYFLNHTVSSSVVTSKLIRVALPKARAAIMGSFAHSKRWSIDFLSAAALIMGRETGTLKTDIGFSLQQDLFFKYWFSRNYFSNLGLFTGIDKVSTEGTSQAFTADVTQTRSGLYFTLGTVF
jgi:hypothetical protein